MKRLSPRKSSSLRRIATSASSALWWARSSRLAPDRGGSGATAVDLKRAAPGAARAAPRRRTIAMRRAAQTGQATRATRRRAFGHRDRSDGKVTIIASGDSAASLPLATVRAGSDLGGKTFRASDANGVMANVHQAGELEHADRRRRAPAASIVGAAERAAAELLPRLGADLEDDGPARHAAAHGRRVRRAAHARAVPRHDLPQRRRLRRARRGRARSRSTRCACTTCCRSTGSRTSATCRASGSSGCPSSPASSSCSPATCRCRSGLTKQIAGWLQRAARAQGRRRRPRGRAPVHVAARASRSRAPAR